MHQGHIHPFVQGVPFLSLSNTTTRFGIHLGTDELVAQQRNCVVRLDHEIRIRKFKLNLFIYY